MARRLVTTSLLVLVCPLVGCFTLARPGWSPDGTEIVFAMESGEDDAGDIFVVNADGTELRNLTESPINDDFPIWSPDGSKIVFASEPEADDDESQPEVYVMARDGSGRVRVSGEGEAYWPAWSPDGPRIVFAFEGSEDDGADLYVVNADGSGRVRLTSHDADDLCGVWSPDGETIAFMRMVSGDDDEADDDSGALCTVPAEGGEVAELVPPGPPCWFPQWSPDGTRIAFLSDRDGNGEIYVIGADGADLTRLTDTPGDEGWVTWSPDGERLLYTLAPSEEDEDWMPLGGAGLWVMNADGSGAEELIDVVGWVICPAWSPDGGEIVFQLNSEDEVAPSGIYTINADGSGIRCVAEG